MTKKAICIIILTVIIFLGINICYTNTYAADKVDDVIEGAKGFLKTGEDVVFDSTKLYYTSNFIYMLLLAIAIVIAVVIGMIIGIQFMVAGVEEKAKVKETLLPYVVGCIVVFGAFGIWKLVVTILGKW